MPRRKNKNNKRRRRSPANRIRPTRPGELTAATADTLALYEIAVQDTEASIELIDAIWSDHYPHPPKKLREDFCGTAKLCCDWVKLGPERVAVGMDNHGPTLEWARVHNVLPLEEDQASRMTLLEQDVLVPSKNDFDVVMAFNFSYWVFHQRAVLKKYFQNACEALNDDGMFLIDLHGGPDAQFKLEEETDRDGFSFVWEQELFDPINNGSVCHIHFKFPDGTKLHRAFNYDWRVWSMPELRELLIESGFSRVDSWWDDENDELVKTDKAENVESWIAYLAAWR